MKSNKKGIYIEDDWKAKVEILEDNSTNDAYQYKLKVIDTLKPSRYYNVPLNGETFEVSRVRNVSFSGMWNLEILKEVNHEIK